MPTELPRRTHTNFVVDDRNSADICNTNFERFCQYQYRNADIKYFGQLKIQLLEDHRSRQVFCT